MPFGEYEDFKDCVEKNKDKKNPQAFCAAVHKKTTGKWPTEMEKNSNRKEFKYSITSRQLGLEKNLLIFMENEEGFCEGWVFESIKAGEKHKLVLGSRVKKLSRAPIKMVDFEGVIPIGNPGASRNYVGIYKILDRGTYNMLGKENNVYKYVFNGKKLNGEFSVRRLEDRELIESSKYQYVFDKNEESLERELAKQIEIYIKQNETTTETIKTDEKLSFVSSLSKGAPLKISGVALREGKWNGLFYPKEEMIGTATTLIGKPLMVDHSNSVRDIVGRVTNAWYELGSIRFEAEVTDKSISDKIINDLISKVSVGVEVVKFVDRDQIVARNFNFKELSLVLDPACDGAEITEFFEK